MVAWCDRLPWRTRTCCVYCGKRISGQLAPHLESGTPAHRRALRLAAAVACVDHLALALAERSAVGKSVDDGDNAAGNDVA